MCGIYGSLSFSPEFDLPLEVHTHLTDLARRRGPDDGGIWTDQAQCVLGLRRLSILDLSPNGHQPMVAHRGRFALVFNGEIYNFKELRHELEQAGVTFKSSGDAEVVLHALIEWGTGALNRFNGMFAIGFYDKAERTLLLARDHAGIKPLYYLHTDKGIMFGSQYDQVLSHPASWNLEVSRDALSTYMHLGYIPAPYALLQNTHAVEGGAWLKFSATNKQTKGRFFEFPMFREPDLKGAEAYEAVDAAITSAVRRQMISDVKIGAFLSGGIDSPLVVAKMRAATTDPIDTFTVGVPNSPLDESADALKYAQQFEVNSHMANIGSDQCLALLDDVVNSCGEPFADYSIFPTLFATRMAGESLKVMLSGDGGDELFGGYVGRFGSVIAKSRDFRRPGWVRNFRWGAKKAFDLGNGYWNLRWRNLGDWYFAKHCRLGERDLETVIPDLGGFPTDFTLFQFEGSEAGPTAQWLRWNEFSGHLSMVLQKVDRASMYNSVEVRVPFLDREVIDVALRVDWSTCLDLRAGVGKIPLRRSLARHSNFQSLQKRGFEPPMSEWLRGPLRPLFEEKVLSRKDILGFPVGKAALQRLFGDFLAGQGNQRGLWVLLSLALWTDRHYQLSQRQNRSLNNASFESTFLHQPLLNHRTSGELKIPPRRRVTRSDIAIKVEGLGKHYRIGAPQEKYKTFRDSISSGLTKPFRAIRSLSQRNRNGHLKGPDSFWALKDVNFEVGQGEVVGVIGRNGAGKSTLLKILSRITEPTVGMADIYGRVGSLLEVGTGFHPELTGRENIYLNGAILGMARKEIDRKFDEMVAFAEIERFIDTPVKHYSSGMYLRLAFAVAAHLDPEILLIDEVLAVGDAAFQKRCLGKMSEVAKQGRTVLFVSHNMGAISQLCSRALLFSGGELIYQGEVAQTVDQYLRAGNHKEFAAINDTRHSLNRSGTGEAKIVKIELADDTGYNTASFAIGQPLTISLELELSEDLPSLVAGIEIKSPAGIPLVNLRSDSQGIDFGPYRAGNNIKLHIKIPGLPFYPGVYSVEPWIGQKRGRRIDQISEDVRIILESQGLYQSERMLQEGRGIMVMDCNWTDGILATAPFRSEEPSSSSSESLR